MAKYFKLSLKENDFFKEHMIDLEKGDIYSYGELVSMGEDDFAPKKKLIQEKIKDYLLPKENGCVDLSKIQEDWFPQINNYDIFISHSHANEKLAIAFSTYLKEYYGLSCFIDSLIWGNVFELQKIIDKDYGYSEKDKNGNILTYSYEKRNFTTSHVHLMLNTALMQSMQAARLFFFLETPESINFKNIKDEWTYSPWIYSELSMSKSMYEIEKTPKMQNFCECVSSPTKIPLIQKAQTSHLIPITKSKIDDICNKKTGENALSSLKNYVSPSSQSYSKTLRVLYENGKKSIR